MEIKNPSQSFLFLCDGLSAVLLAVNLQRSKHVVVERVGRIGFVRFFRLAENFRSVMVQSFDGFVLFPNTNNSRHIIGRGKVVVEKVFLAEMMLARLCIVLVEKAAPLVANFYIDAMNKRPVAINHVKHANVVCVIDIGVLLW